MQEVDLDGTAVMLLYSTTHHLELFLGDFSKRISLFRRLVLG